MSRAKLSEYRAKNIFKDAFNGSYSGLSIQIDKLDKALVSEFVKNHNDRCVLKVDQAIKRRNKLGLIDLNVTSDNVLGLIDKYKDLGYSWLLLEPFAEHDQSEERFLALELAENGVDITYSKSGGVDIEAHPETLETYTIVDVADFPIIGDIPSGVIESLYKIFNDQHLTNLEINPLVVSSNGVYALDAAVVGDTSASSFVDEWSLADIRTPKKELSEEEAVVDVLASNSPASLSLKVLNRDGSIFLLLSGGGASVVVLDEFSAHGFHESIANYGEYSGNPNEEETYLYASQVLSLLVKSTATNKTLLIAGGVANFTDVHHTFKGIVRALADYSQVLQKQAVEVIVRRGGPNQEAGLAYLKEFLDKESIKNEVYDPSVSLSKAVVKVIKTVS